MTKILHLLIFLLVARQGFAQPMAGLTHVPDTSFSTYSAWVSAKKKYPDIKIVNEFHSDAVKEKRGIVYCSTGERELVIDAFYPSAKDNKKRTAIIIIHGGGWRSGNRSQHYPLAQRLAALGYVCFTPEYRLSTEALFPAAIHDAKAAVRWVRKHARKYKIDPNKITILGFSGGGEMAALTGTTNDNPAFEDSSSNVKYSSAVQAIIDIDGTLSFVHPESGEGDDSKKISAASYWLGYSKKDDPLLWQQASPLTHAGKQTPPTLFINSSVARMHAGRDDYIKILEARKIYVEVKSFEDSPHTFCLFDPWFEPTVKYIDEFLKKIFN